MKEDHKTPTIEFFCKELPDSWNLLKWKRDTSYDNAVFEHPEGLVYEMRVYEHIEGCFRITHVMVLELN